MHLFFYSALPIGLLIFVNSLLFYRVYQARRVSHMALENPTLQSNRSINRTIVVSTLIFIVMTLPTAISSILYSYLAQKEFVFFSVRLFDTFSFTFHAFYFLILYRNKKFKKKLIKSFKKCFIRRVNVWTTTGTTKNTAAVFPRV